MEQRIKRVSRTYVLPPETADAAKSLANTVGCNVSHVVETLLEKALAEVASGRWSVESVPVRFHMRLLTYSPCLKAGDSEDSNSDCGKRFPSNVA